MPQNSNKTGKTKHRKVSSWYVRVWRWFSDGLIEYRERRPHRSFRLSRRRDYVRPIVLPGLWALTAEVFLVFWRYRTLFIPLALLYAILYGVLVGLTSQTTYSELSLALEDLGGEAFGGDWGAFSQVGALFVAVMTSGLGVALTEAQQIFAVLLGLMVWLSVVWLLRNRMAGHAVNLRDGLYSSASPLFATIVVSFVIVLQLVPVAIAAIGYAAASSTGLLSGGVEAMLFWFAAGLLALLSFYWVAGSLFALVVVTLPGMYPLKALKNSGDIVFGRRLVLLTRMLWMGSIIFVLWALVLVPLIGFDYWLKVTWVQLEWVPLVPVVLLILSSCTLVWTSIYVYLLYRKVVDYAPH